MQCLKSPIFINLFLLILLAILSCGLPLKTPKPEFISSKTECLVFGRLRLKYKGEDLRVYSESSHKNKTFIYIRKKEDKWGFEEKKIRREDGYFAVALPPGKYKIISIDRWSGPWPKWRPYNSKMCISFEAKPNSATYIGTLMVALKTKKKKVYKTYTTRETLHRHNGVYYKDRTWSGWVTETSIVLEKCHISDELSDAKEVFRSLFLDHDDPIKRLTVVKPFVCP